jgi:hypothetical protein
VTGLDDPDELTYDLEEDGTLVRRQLDRRLWTRGAWATGVYRYQELDRDGAWEPPRAALVRFQKVHGGWKRHAAINLSPDVAVELAATLAAWFPPG